MNRFNQFVRTDYINLPVDYYQAALAAKEQENQGKVNDMRQMLDFAGNVESYFTPDTELKKSHLENIDNQIAELGKQNLKTPEVLMKLNRIINDRAMLTDLIGIQQNTNNYRKYQEAVKKYREENGNDINFQPYEQEIERYNKSGKDGFRSGFLSNASINKFVDVNGEVQKVIEKMKPVNTEKVSSSGGYLYKVGSEELTMEDLTRRAMKQMNDPKFATQLQLTSAYQLRNLGGGDINAGIQKYQQAELEQLTNNINTLTSRLSDYKPDSKEYKQIKGAIDKYSDALNTVSGLSGDKLRNHVYNSNLQDMAAMAADPFVVNNHSEDVKADPLYAIKLRYSLADQNNARSHARDLKNKKDFFDYKQTKEDEANATVPTVSTMQIGGPNGAYHEHISFDNKGGIDQDAMSQTISSLLYTGANIIHDQNDNEAKPTDVTFQDKEKKPISLQQAVKSGLATLGYLPGSKEYTISTNNGKVFRIKADLGMQRSMDKLYKVYDDKSNAGTSWRSPQITTFSLDGKNDYPTLYYKAEEKDDHGNSVYRPHMFQITGNATDISKMDAKQFSKYLGIEFSDNRAKPVGDGVFVAVEYDKDAGTGNGGVIRSKDFLSAEDYKKAVQSGEIQDNNSVHQYLYIKDGKAVPISSIGMQADELIQNEAARQTRKGGNLQYIKNKAASKTTKGSASVRASASESTSTPSVEPEDSEEE